MRAKGSSNLGEFSPKVRLSQHRLPIEPSFSLSLSLYLSQTYFVQMSFAQMSLHANVIQPSVLVKLFQLSLLFVSNAGAYSSGALVSLTALSSLAKCFRVRPEAYLERFSTWIGSDLTCKH